MGEDQDDTIQVERLHNVVTVLIRNIEVQVIEGDDLVHCLMFDEAKDVVREMWLTFSEAKDRR